jgi:A/G-specific adenine glycosylase
VLPATSPEPGERAQRRASIHGAAGYRRRMTFAQALLEWYARNRRPLPWRETRDPYALLVSEVMLQQTQAARVIPYYEAFLARFPTAQALAAATPREVLEAWSGLGYNRRALALHSAVKQVADTGWPDDLTELPGVGPYTAAAIRNQSYGEPVLPVDTNVARIQARTGHAFGPEALQALFDLGATVCLARIPRCGACPFSGGCPSRGRRYEPARKQSRFEGSFRQRRAALLKLVATDPLPVDGLDPEAVESLSRDGLVVVQEGLVALPA